MLNKHTTSSNRRPYRGRNARGYARVSVGVLIGLTLTLLALLIGLWLRPDYLELRLLDWRQQWFALPAQHAATATLVIDDASLEQLGRWPWPRRYLAETIRVCREAGAVEVLLDVLIPEEQPVEAVAPGITDISSYEHRPGQAGARDAVQIIDNDARLAAAMVVAGNVVAPFYGALHWGTDSAAEAAPERTFYRQVRNLLQQHGPLTFTELYPLVYPDGDILRHDADYERLKRAYIWARAMVAVAAHGFTPAGPVGPRAAPGLLDITPPVPIIAEAAADIAFVSIEDDSDGAVRRAPLLAQYEGRLYKQLAFAAFCRYAGIANDDLDLSHPRELRIRGRNLAIPLDERGGMLISWTRDWADDAGNLPVTWAAAVWQIEAAIAENTHRLRIIDNLDFQLAGVPADLGQLDEPTRAAVQDMRAQRAALGDAAALRQANAELAESLTVARQRLRERLAGKIVLLGSVATGEAAARDFVRTPVSPLTPGVMVHRNVLNTLLHGAFIRRAPRWLDALITLMLGLGMTLVAAYFRPLVSGLTLVLLGLMTLPANFFAAFGTGHYWLAVVMPMAAVLAAFGSVTFYRQITEGRDRRRITARFKQYVSPSVVDRIVRQGGVMTFAGELRPVTCYFSDLAGFTSTSEKLGPEKTVRVLNVYLDCMTEVLDRHEATINKFEGDGVFAFFGAPVAMSDHARRGCLAALDAQDALAALVRQRQADQADWPALQMRIGLSTGNVVVGDCGSQRRFDYTAIGDTVNLAARLESGNKYFGTRLMISEATYAAARGAVAVRPLGKVRVVGKTIGVGIYELLGRADYVAAADLQYAERFAQGIGCFQEGRLEDAVAAFTACRRERPYDKAVQLYLDAIAAWRPQGGPGDDFDGCVELSGK